MPAFPPIASGTTRLAVAVYFTSWNDANYSFSGSIVPNDDGNDLDINEFGPGSTNDWMLDCASCVNTGTSILPPGVTNGGSHSSPPTRGAGSTGAAASATPGQSTVMASTSPSIASPPASASPTASGSTAATPGPSAQPTPSAGIAPLGTTALTGSSSSRNDSPSWVVGAGVAAVATLGGASLLLTRRLRRNAIAGDAPATDAPEGATARGEKLGDDLTD